MSFDNILVTHDDGVTTITINRPPFNLATPGLIDDLMAAFDELEGRDETRAIVLRGAGERAFCAGADIGHEKGPAGEGRGLRDAGRALVERIEMFPKVIIAAIRGWCIGGGTGIAWPCDIRIASDTAKFRAGDVYLGIIPSWSVGMVRLVNYLGRNRTLDLLLLGEDISAERALELGIVSRVVPDAAFEAEVDRVAKRLASGAPMPIRAIKEAVRAQCREGFDRAALLEEAWAQKIFASQDAKEGLGAFMEKRKPVFTGK
ncbi:putative enoyl-CoA hydratase [Oceanibacterium hippocampi]|uniref:Putative enoyl-CoA hydratase n=1 Tax=Oceanibacterium hippocampi TaxID=745714 RepID=A0A1Y5TI26_9PROT|nr:putative enoyl-CoA hydratase [Oceanibacterium hippocampi]